MKSYTVLVLVMLLFVASFAWAATQRVDIVVNKESGLTIETFHDDFIDSSSGLTIVDTNNGVSNMVVLAEAAAASTFVSIYDSGYLLTNTEAFVWAGGVTDIVEVLRSLNGFTITNMANITNAILANGT